jgi:hypothetical protein
MVAILRNAPKQVAVWLSGGKEMHLVSGQHPDVPFLDVVEGVSALLD